ncbi:beta-propeller fold lactonase family protein [Ancylobacter sp. FA202]|uniref:YVTN family beta-propeller repeat protein n=1 Tax=Ancylobacter sp. FA202 TaxID=1111106 RepID=UPI0012DD73CC|nr:beta-propeller fold lactonase family protein [Ancylobacter sp. FA202]
MEKLLFSTDTDSGTITVLNVTGNDAERVAVIPVGNGPRGAVRFTKSGIGFVTNHAGNTLSVIDAYSLTEVDRIVVGVAPIGCALLPGGKTLIVSNAGDNTVSFVNVEDRHEFHRLGVGREPRHPDVTPDGKYGYVPISVGQYVSKISLGELASGGRDLNSISEIAQIAVGDGAFPYSSAVSPDGQWVIAANNQVGYVSLISVATDSVEAQINVGEKGARGTAYTPDSQTAFVSLENSSEVAVIDLRSREVVKRLSSGSGPRGLLFDADSGTLFTSAFDRTKTLRQGNAVSFFSFSAGLTSFREAEPAIRDVPVGAGPCSVSLYVR